MIESDDSLNQKDALTGVIFYVDDIDDPTAMFFEHSPIPLPDVGDTVELNEFIESKSGTENMNMVSDDGGHFVVEDVEYMYSMAEYEQNNEKTNQLFAYVYINITPTDEA